MGKKNRKNRRPHSVLSSLKDLSSKGSDTLSRLATTVKADMPTLMLGTSAGVGSGTVKTDGIGPRLGARPTSRLSRFAKKFVPFKKGAPPAGAFGAPLHTAQKMKKLSHQMALGNPKMKIRRSRLPLVVMMFMLMTLGGGYYAYQNVTLPNVAVGKYLDYKTWLGNASGLKETPKTTGASASTKSSFKAPKLTKSEVVASKKFSKLSRSQKEKVWKAKLATLKKSTGSSSKYKTTSIKTSTKSSFKKKKAHTSRR